MKDTTTTSTRRRGRGFKGAGLLALVAALAITGCKKKELPPLPPPPAAVGAPAAATAAQSPPVGVFPAVGALPSAPVPTTSPVLEKFLASPAHQKIAGLVGPMLKLMDAGQCSQAVESANALSQAIHAAGADFKLSMDVKAMARAIQDDPNFMDRPYMNYKSQLVGLAVGIDLAPMTVQLSAKIPTALKKACEGFAKLLRDIRPGPEKK